MSIVCELLESDRVDITTGFVLYEGELDQVRLFQRLAIGRICVMVEQPTYNVLVIKDLTF